MTLPISFISRRISPIALGLSLAALATGTALALPAGSDPAPAGPAHKAPKCDGKIATIRGTNGDDTGRRKLLGTAKDDVIYAAGGNDLVKAGAGDDIVCGVAGNDKLKGEAGDDILLGAAGKDNLDGGPGDDACDGGSGKNKLKNCEGAAGNAVAVADATTLAEDAPATTIDVLANDTAPAAKTVSSKTDADHGAVAITNAGADLSYTPVADFCGPDSFTYTLNATSTATVSITVGCVNDAPSDIALSSAFVAPHQPLGTTVGNLSATDPDPGDTHSFALVPGAGSADNAKFAIDGATLKTAADLDPLTYSIRVRATDSASPALATEKQLQIVTNVAPAIDLDPATAGNDSAAAFIEDSLAVSLAPNATVTDADANLAGGEIKIANRQDGVAESLSVNVGATGIAASYDSSTGVLTLTNSASVAGYEQVLRSAKYANSSDTPNLSARSVTVKLNDGQADSPTRSATVSVAPHNDAPLADDETFNNNAANSAIPNTTLNVGTAEPQPAKSLDCTVAANCTVLTGDTDPDTASPSLTAGPLGSKAIATQDLGKVTLEADGNFTYFPKPGTSCTDHADQFDYTLHDNDGLGDATDTATVFLATTTDCVWYVDSAAPAGGTGSADQPFNTLNGVSNGADPDGPGATLMILSPSSYVGGLALENNQTLITKRVGLTIGGFAIVTAAGATNPTISNAAGTALTLASANTVQGIDLGTTPAANASLAGSSVGASTINTSTAGLINNPTGGAVDISGGTLNMAFSSVSSTGATSDAIRLDNTRGAFAASAGALQNAGGQDVDISGTNTSDDVVFTYDGTITDDLGQLVNVSGQSGGTKDFNGTISDGNDGDGSGVSLSNNTGATVRFDGGLTLATGANPAFAATGGGTVAITDPNAAGTAPENTAATAAATALNVSNTTIADADLTFQKVSSSGAANGIVLNNTANANGKLIVTGNSAGLCGGAVNTATTPATVTAPSAADCTGGSISNSTGVGISLTNVPGGASFTRIQVNGSGDDGVLATSVGGGVSFIHSLISANGNAAQENGLEYQDVSGTTAIDATTVSGSGYHNANLRTLSSATHNIDVIGSVFSAPVVATGASGLLITANGNSVVNADVTGSLMTASRDAGFIVTSGDSPSSTPTLNVNFLNNDIVGDPANAVPASPGLTIGTGNGTDAKILIQNNDITNSLGKGLVLNPIPNSNNGSTFDATVNNNRIGNAAANSGSDTSNAIDLTAAGSATTRMAITNNAVKHWGINALRIDSGEKEVVNAIGSPTNSVASADFTVTGNAISNPDPGSVDTMQINAGVQSAAAAQNVCADYGGAGALSNAFGGQHGAGAGDFDLQISERFAAALRFPGFAGDGSNQTDIQTFVRSRNTGSPTVALIDNPIANSGGAACSTPALPPAVTP